MDWITVLKSQQADFIRRLHAGKLLNCDRANMHSELTVISGEKLHNLTQSCWNIADKYKHSSPISKVFKNTIQRKLGEELIKYHFGDLVTEIDPQNEVINQDKIAFILKDNPRVKIQVKTRYGGYNKFCWSLSAEEAKKNDILICIFHEKEFDDYDEYSFVLAGFIPKSLLSINEGMISLEIDDLLYIGGLRFYLQEVAQKPSIQNINLVGRTKKKGDYQEAIAKYTKAIKIHSQDEKLYVNRGIVFFITGKLQESLEDLNKAIKINPFFDLAYHWRAYIYRSLGQYQAAIKDYTQEIAINPNHVYAFYNRGLTYLKNDNYQAAIEDYTQAILISPSFFQCYYNRGYARYCLGDHTGAIEDYNYAIEINSNLFQAYYSRGVARGKMGDTEGAIADYTKAISINSNHAKAYYNRAVIFYKQGDYKSALEDYNQSLRIDRSLFPAYYNRGIVLSELKEQHGVFAAYYDGQVTPHTAEAYKKLDLARVQIDGRLLDSDK